MRPTSSDLFVRISTALVIACLLETGPSSQEPAGAYAREIRIPAAGVSLYSRVIGHGTPVIVLHGGPDFDHRYLLPDLDRLADRLRLIYYDQRGRGMSAEGVRPEDVTLASDLDDIARVREHYGLHTTALLGHSWGAVLALEYALRDPSGVSHLVLMNPAPASAHDVATFRKAYVERLGADMDRQRAITATEAYRDGDPETVAARYRIHFKFALARPEDFERLMKTMRAAFVSQGKAGIVKARAVEDRLMHDSWDIADYDLLPRLRTLRVPTLVITGDHELIPPEMAEHIASAMPNATLITLAGCGHFAYLECPREVHDAIDAFLGHNPSR